MDIKAWSLAVLLLIVSRPVAARSIATGRVVERELTREARWDSGADQTADAASEVNELIAGLANLSIPHYLKDLYVNFSNSDGQIGGMKANTIRSYENTAKRSAGCGFYKFDTDKDHVGGEDIKRAELRLFQKKSPVLDGHYRVTIHYLLRQGDLESPLHIVFEHVSSSAGWKIFDITQIAQGWKQKGFVNYGLQVRIYKGDQVVPCDGIFCDGTEGLVDTEPSLVVYTNEHDFGFFEELLKEEKKLVSHVNQRRRQRRSTLVNIGSCALKEFNVTKEHLSTDVMKLIFPRGFNAGMCAGHCKRIDPSDHKTLTHTSILSLYHLNTGTLQDAPKRCCVPTEYKHIPLMYFHNVKTNQRILKANVPGIATKCGCL